MRFPFGHLLSGLVLIAVGSRADVQTWTSVDGRTVEGEFVRLFGSSVTIKRANGATVSCMLTSLNEASREQAKQLAEAAKAAPAKNGVAQATGAKPGAAGLSALKPSGIPTEEEIKAFLTEYKETPHSPEAIEFTANFSVPFLKPDDVRAFTKKKKVPYRITVELNKVKLVDGKEKRLRMDGQAFIVVLNEAGEVVDREREALGKLCPS
jgi:hypothetical protein